MSYMPVWYQQGRSALLLIQSVIALLLVSCSMNRRKQFYLRLITSVLAGCAVQYLVRGIYIAGSTPPAMLSHAAAALLVYITLSAITWFCYDESIWTVLLMTATGYIGQDIAGSVKTLFRQIEWVNSFSRQQGGILIVDLVCYGAVYVLMFFALRPFVRNRNDNFDNKRKAVSSVLVLLLCIGMARLTQDNPNRNQQAVIAEAMPVRIPFGLGETVDKGDFLLTGIFHMNGEHIAIPGRGQGDEALAALGQCRHGVDGVGQGILEKRIQIQLLYEREIRHAHRTGQHDVPLLADADFFCQKHIQHFIARIGGALIGGNGMLQLIQLLLGYYAPEGFQEVL